MFVVTLKDWFLNTLPSRAAPSGSTVHSGSQKAQVKYTFSFMWNILNSSEHVKVHLSDVNPFVSVLPFHWLCIDWLNVSNASSCMIEQLHSFALISRSFNLMKGFIQLFYASALVTAVAKRRYVMSWRKFFSLMTLILDFGVHSLKVTVISHVPGGNSTTSGTNVHFDSCKNWLEYVWTDMYINCNLTC